MVVDSVAALTPKAEIDGEMGDAHMGLQARLMSQALRKLTAACAKQDCAVVFINQLRQKIGVVFGNPETTTGGNALKFYASVRLDIRRTGQIKQRGGHCRLPGPGKGRQEQARPTVSRGRVRDPLRRRDQPPGASCWTLASTAGSIEKSGAWYSLDGERMAQGRDRGCTWLAEHPEPAERLRARLVATAEDRGLADARQPGLAGSETGSKNDGNDEQAAKIPTPLN